MIIAKVQIKLQMKMAAGLKFFREMLDRIMEAPINLYFDITSIGAIQSKFTRDLGAVEGSFFDVLQRFLNPLFKLSCIFVLIVANIPQILVFFAIMGYLLLRIHWRVSPARK